MRKTIYCMLALMAISLIGGDEKKGYMGVQLSTVDQLGHEGKASEHVRITHVYEGTGAEEAGLETGDVVLKLNGVDIANHAELTDALSEYHAGDTISIMVRRGDLDMEMDLLLGNQPSALHFGNRWVQVLHKERAFAGLELMYLNHELAKFFEVEGGALVKKVTEDGPSAEAGIKVGDIILQWGEDNVSKQGQVRSYLARIKPGEMVSVTVQRKGNRKTLELTTGAAKNSFEGNFKFSPEMNFEIKGLEGLHSLEGIMENLPQFDLQLDDDHIQGFKMEIQEFGEELGEQLKNLKIDFHDQLKVEKKEKKAKEKKEDN